MPSKAPKTIAFIDASNLFYGGEKTLGWKIDYNKLYKYLQQKYNAKKVYYFGGIETHSYQHNYKADETVNLPELIKHLRREARENIKNNNKRNNERIEKLIGRAKFYKKLQKFGYHLVLKPVKIFTEVDGRKRLKANCDIDMALCMVKDMDKYDRALVLSGDGDFMPVLKHAKHNKKEVIMLARGKNTAKEIKKFAGENFRDFITLRSLLEQKTRS